MNICIDIHHEKDSKAEKTAPNQSLITSKSIQELDSCFSDQKKSRSKKRYLKESQYNWNQTQNRRYINFLTKNGHLLLLPTEQKKKMRVNVLMSKCVQSRNSTQCHTHHQKMIEKYGTVQGIIQKFSFLPKNSKKVQQQITPPLVSNQVEQNDIVEQMQESLLRPSFFMEYLMPIVFEKEEECFDYIWQL